MATSFILSPNPAASSAMRARVSLVERGELMPTRLPARSLIVLMSLLGMVTQTMSSLVLTLSWTMRTSMPALKPASTLAVPISA